MKLVKETVVEGYNKPRSKPTYSGIENRNLQAQPLSEDFKQDIRNRMLPLIINNRHGFPVVFDIAIFVEIYSNKLLNLGGVLKNVMDSMNMLVMTDDCRVSSAGIYQYPAVSESFDRVLIRVLQNKETRLGETEEAWLDPYTILKFELDTVVTDRYLGYPELSTNTIVVSENNDNAIKEILISKLGVPSELLKSAGVSITMESNSNRSDIDNIAMNYLYNLRGVGFGQLTDVKVLNLVLRRRSDADEKATIQLYSME